MNLVEVQGKQWFIDTMDAIREGRFSSEWLARRLSTFDDAIATEIHQELPYLLISALYQEFKQ